MAGHLQWQSRTFLTLGNDLFWHAWIHFETQIATKFNLCSSAFPEMLSWICKQVVSQAGRFHTWPTVHWILTLHNTSPYLLMVGFHMIMCRLYCVLHNLLSCCTKIVHELFMWKWKEKWLMSAEMNVKRNWEYLDQCKYCGHYWRLNLVWGECTQLCLLSFLLFFCLLICSVFSFLFFLFVPCRKDPHASLRSPSCSWRESSCRPD